MNQALGGNASAPLLMSSVNFEEIVQCQKSGNWAKAGEILAEQARLLESIGAEGILIGANTMHKVADAVQNVISVPLLHILDVVADSIKVQGLCKVALLGTHYVMADNFYVDGLRERGVEPIVPNDKDKLEIHRIILKSFAREK
uniref:LysA activator protein n=1 Tax=Aggregatibacter actinomycetemcomitans TaxID=714 RepID=P70716_AGGAC|nr:LysA activator protein [Aggregatibacter actinomycetemcomitans Y4]